MSLILASSSPRRSALLTQIGIAHRIISAEIDESPLPNETPLETVARLAQAKAAAIACHYPDEVIVAADTIVIVDGQLLGKPKNPADAQAMLYQLSGRHHQVASAFCVQKGQSIINQTHIAEVKMRHFDEPLIQAYLASGEGMDKAGAYAIQGLGAVLVESICGDFYTIVGLPIAALCATLRTFAIMPFHCR